MIVLVLAAAFVLAHTAQTLAHTAQTLAHNRWGRNRP